MWESPKCPTEKDSPTALGGEQVYLLCLRHTGRSVSLHWGRKPNVNIAVVEQHRTEDEQLVSLPKSKPLNYSLTAWDRDSWVSGTSQSDHQVHENAHHRFQKQAEPLHPTASCSWEEDPCMIRLLRCLNGLYEHSYPPDVTRQSNSSTLSSDFKDGKIFNIPSCSHAPRPLSTSGAMKAGRMDEVTWREKLHPHRLVSNTWSRLPSHWDRAGVRDKQSREAEDHQVYLKSLNNVSQNSKH